jgi:hypothetical protein
MAANPQYPPPRGSQRGPGLTPKLKLLKKSRFPWPLLAIVAAAAILVALIVWLPTTPQRQAPPSAADVPPQPTGSQIQLTNLSIEPAPVGTAMYLSGIIHNQGNTAITGIQVQASFTGSHGQTLQTQVRAVQGLTGPNNTTPQDFTQSPIRPNQDRPFRIYFDDYPAGWNKQVPALKVTEVTATTGKPVPPNPPSPRIG